MDDSLGACSYSSDSGQLFSPLFQFLVGAMCNISMGNKYPEDYGSELLTGSKKFDFIVVGAGSAGATIAGRLSENPNHNVLLLEAGDDPPFYTQIPAYGTTFEKTKYDWEYYAEPSTTHSWAIRNGSSYISRGKMLGGCSSINGMVYIRGNRRDYDSWAAAGNTGWGYDTVLKYFKKSENLRDEELLKIDQGKYHGTTGEIKVSKYGGNIGMQYIYEALNELGYIIKEDINTETNIGFGKLYATLDQGIRSSTATAFLKEEKENLFIARNALVSKVIIHPLRKEATGVEFINADGEVVRVKASKEVIVSGGAINSPQILMLSGVGPAEHLRRLRIPVIADLSVGLNLQDHFVGLLAISFQKDATNDNNNDDLNEIDAMYDYLMHKTGPLVGIGAPGIVGFINTQNSTAKYPNAQWQSFYYNKNGKGLREYFTRNGYSDEFIDSLEEKNKDSAILMVLMYLLNPKSTGDIKLRNSDPLTKPMIRLNYLQEKEDVDVMLQTIKFIQKFIKTSTMKAKGAALIQPALKRCSAYNLTSDEYWVCYLRSVGTNGYHFAGSVKMGPSSDKTAVVSPTLKVHGIKGLRVADAGIMPSIVSGNTNAASIMIGEKAADVIKADWK